jgi:hypothetical protein
MRAASPCRTVRGLKEPRDAMQTCQSDFACALRNPDLAVPTGVIAHNSDAPRERFAVYRNNVMVGLVSALEARFPATRKIVGEDFFKGAAKLFAAAHPPRSPLMMFYGDEFPAFLAAFEPARDVPYLADVARVEAARTRAYHAADAKPLTPAALSGSSPDALADMVRWMMRKESSERPQSPGAVAAALEKVIGAEPSGNSMATLALLRLASRSNFHSPSGCPDGSLNHRNRSVASTVRTRAESAVKWVVPFCHSIDTTGLPVLPSNTPNGPSATPPPFSARCDPTDT